VSWTEGTLEVDFQTGTVRRKSSGGVEEAPLGSARGFDLVSEAWLRAGWDAKYVYTFTWFGRPVIQLPEDLLRTQEVIYALRPDVIIETGVAHGGSIVFYASLCKAMDCGRVIGVDIDIRPHNRAALEEHGLRGYYDLVEGSSIAEDVVERVRELASGAKSRPGRTRGLRTVRDDRLVYRRCGRHHEESRECAALRERLGDEQSVRSGKEVRGRPPRVRHRAAEVAL
jgi:hypothetical protein